MLKMPKLPKIIKINKTRKTRNIWPALMAVALIEAAFFLPAMLSEWSDRLLLDEPHITRQEEEREGFAESVQMPVAERLLLLADGNVIGMVLEDEAYVKVMSGMFMTEAYVDVDINQDSKTINAFINGVRERETPFLQTENVPDAVYSVEAAEAEEAVWKWNSRLERVQKEIRNLQEMGGMPYLWGPDDEVRCEGFAQILYIDQDSQVSFLVYNMVLSSPPYLLRVTVDGKSGRILAFRLNLGNGTSPNWGYRGAARFGAAWRDYWGMDSVNSAWDSTYNHSILEMPPELLAQNGSYNSNSGVDFTYDGQTLCAPLTNWVYNNLDSVLEWNTLWTISLTGEEMAAYSYEFP